MSKSAPVIAIIGRPNVGKSTLFNCLCRRRDALVLDEPGVTRDRHYGPFSIDGQAFLLMDTGGVQDVDHLNNTIDLGMQAQVEKALLEADILFIVLDGREGPTEGDKYLVEKIRPLNREKLIFYLVNKMDHSSQDQDLFNFYELGVSPFFPISAEHKKGIDALKEEVLAQWQAGHGLRSSEDLTFLGTDNNAVRLTLLGRPNVGKSTLMNAILDEERSLVTEVPGTTRDAIASQFQNKGIKYHFVDTAGIRSQGKTEGLEGLMVLKTFQALKKAHLAILVLDIAEGITAQDCRVAGMAHDRGRGLIIFANKFDLLQKSKEENPENLRRQIREEIYDKMPFVRYAPIIIGSALKGRFSKSQFFNKLNAVEKYRHLEVKTAELNRYLQEVLKKRPLPTRGGKRLKIYYMTQSLPQNEKRGIQPTTPSFLCFVNFPKKVHYSDERFLVNCLRKRYEFMGNPIFLEFRSSQRLKIDKSL